MAGGSGYPCAQRMATVWQDLTLAARLLRKSPGFTAAAIVTLALGIGANATMFSFADAVLLRTLPVRDADRIVHIYQHRPGRNDALPLSFADYVDYRRESQSFEALSAHYPGSPLHLVVDGEPSAVNGSVVSASYFDVLQLQPVLGRLFTADEDRVPDRDAVAVISYGLWQRAFGGTPSVIGQGVRINDHPFTIIGVMPATFTGVHNGGVGSDVWMPSAMFRIGYRFCDALRARDCTIVDMLGRMKPGVSIASAQAELDGIAAGLAATYPASNRDARTQRGLGVTVVSARGRGLPAAANTADTQQLQLLLLAVALVLLIGCANVAGLLLSRAIRRRKEIAVRLAIGASRARLVRQLFTESALLAALGAGAGLLIAFWGKDFVGRLEPSDYAGRPRDLQTGLSGIVFIATAATTLVATVLLGVVPALQASTPDVIPALKDEGPSGGATRARLRQALVIGQLALAVMLLVGAGLLVRSVDKVLAGPGFDPRPIITVRLRPMLVNYPLDKALAFQRAVVARLESLPGVISASPADSPATTIASGDATEREMRVGPKYFATLGIPLLEGREFDGLDSADAAGVVVVNDVMAQRISPDGHVVGRALTVQSQTYEIVGVVRDTTYYPVGQPKQAVVYRNYWQPNRDGSFNRDSRTIIRVTGDAAAMMPTVRRAITAVDAAVPISEDYPLSVRVGYEFQPVQRARTLIAAFALLALTLAAIGLYSVLAFTVGQRRREIGVRVALGATGHDVSRLVLREGLGMVATGTVLGLAGAWTSATLVANLLYGIEPRDPSTFVTAPAILILVALVACYIPARRAARVSPMSALKYE
jgi:putative ABC transport system permease protein